MPPPPFGIDFAIPLSTWPTDKGTAFRDMRFRLDGARNQYAMRNRQSTLLWMKDLIEHLSTCHDQLEWAADGRTETFLTETMLVDLVECQRLCEQLRSSKRTSRAVLNPA
jgi:hypothetical protein